MIINFLGDNIVFIVSLWIFFFFHLCDSFRSIHPRTSPYTNGLVISEFHRSSVLFAVPNRKDILMPALSSTMKEGLIVEWNKKVGDQISAGEVLVVVQSDKADMDVESFENGFLGAIFTQAGEIAPVGTAIATIVDDKSDIQHISILSQALVPTLSLPTDVQGIDSAVAHNFSVNPSLLHKESESSVPIINTGRISASGYAKQLAAEKNIDLRTIVPSRSDGYITSKDLNNIESSLSSYPLVATPMAKKLAVEHGVDLSTIKGTGNFGRIIPEDILRVVGKQRSVGNVMPVVSNINKELEDKFPVPKEIVDNVAQMHAKVMATIDAPQPLSAMQHAVARNMEKSLSVPVFRVSRDIMMDRFDELYEKLKQKGVTVSAMLAKAVAMVLCRNSFLNSCYQDGAIKYNRDINIAMAVALSDGLITPTLKNADRQDIFSLARSWKELVIRAKTKKLTPDEYSSGTFTISNLGMFGVSQFDAILPPGTGAILATSASLPRVVQSSNGFFCVQKYMTVTVTADHRHIYGTHVAEFLRELANLIETEVHLLTMG